MWSSSFRLLFDGRAVERHEKNETRWRSLAFPPAGIFQALPVSFGGHQTDWIINGGLRSEVWWRTTCSFRICILKRKREIEWIWRAIQGRVGWLSNEKKRRCLPFFQLGFNVGLGFSLQSWIFEQILVNLVLVKVNIDWISATNREKPVNLGNQSIN